MSVENFDGDGLADQPSIIYAFETDDSDNVEIRELARSGFGEVGPSPGDVLERETTKSTLTDGLPELELPGERGIKYDDCGEEIPAFACLGHNDESSAGCGKPVYVGRSCASPTCERDWPAAVKQKVVRTAGKLDGLRRALYARYDGQKEIDFNHVVASLPELLVDSDNPLKRALLIIKTLLEEHWHIDGFVAIFHPYRIKKEYRADQYDHGGEAGQGDMTWSDVLDHPADEREKYLCFEPHFHTFFPAPRASFDYSVAEAIEEQSGWLFHRITKGGQDSDSNVSVSGLDDLVHQLTYCYSHSGVRQVADRHELASRMKGDLHNCYIPDGVEEQVLAMFCDAAPKLLGVQFANLNEATCSAEISEDGIGTADAGSDSSQDACGCDDTDETHPLYDVWNPGTGMSSATTNGNPWPKQTFQAGAGDQDRPQDTWATGSSSSSSTSSKTSQTTSAAVSDETPPEQSSDAADEVDSPAVDSRSECGGILQPIHNAESRLDDNEWCRQAEYVSGLRDAYAEWLDRTGGDEDHPWVDDDSLDDDLDDTPAVVQPD